MHWLRSKLNLRISLIITIMLLLGCSSTPEVVSVKKTYCLTSGGDQDFDCETETKEKTIPVKWNDKEKFREVLSAITLPLLSAPTHEKESRVLKQSRLNGKKGFTVQLAAFQEDAYFTDYVGDIKLNDDLYHFTTNAGFHNVSIGYYEDLALAKKVAVRLSEQGLDYWIRPISLVELKRLKK